MTEEFEALMENDVALTHIIKAAFDKYNADKSGEIDINDINVFKDIIKNMLKEKDKIFFENLDNFYPKSYRIDSNKQRLTSDEIFYETKASLTDNRIVKELYDKAFI